MTNPDVICPLHDNIYVERIVETESSGGILIPGSFDYKFSARLKFNAVPDYFRAKVLAVGPNTRELRDEHGEAIAYGDELYVYSWAGSPDGSKLMTFEPIEGKHRGFIKPDDIVTAVRP